MWLSSLHRITGLLLSLGAVALAVWLIALAGGPAAFADVQAVFGSAWFKLPLIVWTFCFSLHLANGIRHLVWDMGYGFELPTARLTGRLALFGSAAASVLVWLYVAMRAA